MVVACLIKEIRVSTELRTMSHIDNVSEEMIQKIIHKKFEAPDGKKENNDPLIRGEFEVIKELLAKVSELVLSQALKKVTQIKMVSFFI